ncbi:transcriptional repressor [Alicyclobacillus contaminans]|uniref:transcriptional repressor n=1 Tax=Alicyclobacillus contaminans TaxID=392016 RepID=UPI0004079938|nr:transcriptional repressor [Alicyclobacillus contaminans]
MRIFRSAKYRLKCHESHHHHLVCVGCGETFALDECPMDQLRTKIDSRFKVLDHRFEIYGYCSHCNPAS